MASEDTNSLAFENLQITSFDPHVCAKLHNILVDRAIQLSPETYSRYEPSPTPNDVLSRSDLSFITDRLSPSLLTFLQECKLFPPYPPYIRLMPFATPLWIGAFHTYENWKEPEEGPNAVCLFQAPQEFTEGGLFFDQDTGLARFVTWPSPGWPEDEDGWMPLELILRRWIRMWDEGFIAIYGGPDHPHCVCPLLSWNADAASQLDATLMAWKKLLDAITTRMPADAFEISPANSTARLASQAALHVDPNGGIPRVCAFAKDFLERGQRPPPLRSGKNLHVAPGLMIPEDDVYAQGVSTIKTQIVFAVDDRTEASNGSDGIHIKQEWEPFVDEIAFYVAGPTGRLAEQRVFNPYNVQQDRYIVCPWNFMRGLRLIDILQHWTRCIEDSRWTIGPEGVEGSIQDFIAAGKSYAMLDWRQIEI